MRMNKFFTMLCAAVFLFSVVAPLAYADDYDLTNKRTGGFETATDTASGDLIVVWDASANAWKTMSATDPVISGDVTFQTNLLALGRKGGVSTMSSSSTDLDPLNAAYVVYVKRAGGANCMGSIDGGTRLPNGTPGQVIVCYLAGVEAGGSWIITPNTSTTFTDVTLNTAKEHVTLLFIDTTVGWIIISNEGGVVTSNLNALGFE